MSEKTVPFTKEQIEQIIRKYPTPFHIYDEKAIIANARRIKEAFAWSKGFKNYFAVKALPNPSILKLLHNEGFDNVSLYHVVKLFNADTAFVVGGNFLHIVLETTQ